MAEEKVESPKKTPPPAGPAFIAVPVAGILAGLVGMALSGNRIQIDLGIVCWFVACLFGAAGVVLGAYNARLLALIRHTYNLHYVVLVPVALFGWSLAFAPTIGGPEWLTQLLWGLMIGSASAAMSCVAASIFAQPQRQWGASLFGAALAFSLVGSSGPAAMLVATVFCALGIWVSVGKERPIPQLSNGVLGVIGMISFLAISVIALLGLGQLLVMILKPIFQDFAGPQPRPPRVSEIVRIEVARIALGAICALLAFATSYLWPQRRATGLLIGAGMLSALVAAGGGGYEPYFSAAVPVGLMMVALVGATALASLLPLRQRWAAALIAGAVGGLIGMDFFREIPSEHPMALGTQWIIESVALIVLWMSAYLLGMRQVRAWREKAPGP
ncbi:hypothetical protein KQI84_10630 [bacterium]|nr:hypothetical protein [bacterium]